MCVAGIVLAILLSPALSLPEEDGKANHPGGYDLHVHHQQITHSMHWNAAYIIVLCMDVFYYISESENEMPATDVQVAGMSGVKMR